MRWTLFCQEALTEMPIAAKTSAKRASSRRLSVGIPETTATLAVAVLLALTRSKLVVVTLAELTTRPVVDGAVTINVIVAELIAARLPTLQMTVVVPTH